MSTSHRVTFAALFLAGVLCAAALLVGRETSDPGSPGQEQPVEVTHDKIAPLDLVSVVEAEDEAALDPSTEPTARESIVVEPRAKPKSAPEPRVAMVEPTSVRVVDERGAAVPDARVGADLRREDGSRIRVARAVTDALGDAAIDTAGAQSVKLTVTPAADDLVHAGREVELDVAPVLVVALSTRNWLVLTVVDGEKLPVADVEWVELEGDRGPLMPTDRRSDGPSGVHRIEVGDAPGIARVRSTRAGVGKHAFDPADPSTMHGTVRLVRPSVLEAVTMRDGIPLAGVRVALVERAAPECLTVGRLVLSGVMSGTERLHGEQISDADGRVSFAIHEFRAYVLVAEAQGVGACETSVVVDKPGQRVEAALQMSRGNAVDLRVAGTGLVWIWLNGPAGTRRAERVAPGTTFVADGLPPGRYLASPGWSPLESGRHFALDGDARMALELTPRPRCRLEVAGTHEVELYAAGCPPRRVPETERRVFGARVFESDDPGPHVLVRRERSGNRAVHVLPFELSLGEQSLRLQPPKQDATFELVASISFDAPRHWWRSALRDGLQSFYELRSDGLLDPVTGKGVECKGWSAVVPSGVGDLVRVASDGSFEVVRESVRIEAGETRRIVLESDR